MPTVTIGLSKADKLNAGRDHRVLPGIAQQIADLFGDLVEGFEYPGQKIVLTISDATSENVINVVRKAVETSGRTFEISA